MNILKRWVEKIAARSELAERLREEVDCAKESWKSAAGLLESAVAESNRLRKARDDDEAERERLIRQIERLDQTMAEQKADLLRKLEQAEGAALRRRRDWRRPEEAMDAEQLAAAFDVPADHGLWQAVHQELDSEIMGAVDDATAPGCADRDFRSGGVDALRGFQRRLIDARAKAQVAKRQAKEE